MDDTHSDALARLTVEVERLNNNSFIRRQNSLWKVLAYQFARGLAFGLGSVIGATILLSLAAWWLSQLEFIPIVGEWISLIVQEIEDLSAATQK